VHGVPGMLGSHVDVYVPMLGKLPHLVVADLDVVEGQAADRGGLLGVEQDKQASDAVLGIEGVVVQQVAGSGPSTRGISDALNTLPLR
jgi:hypothetical protein